MAACDSRSHFATVFVTPLFCVSDRVAVCLHACTPSIFFCSADVSQPVFCRLSDSPSPASWFHKAPFGCFQQPATSVVVFSP